MSQPQPTKKGQTAARPAASTSSRQTVTPRKPIPGTSYGKMQQRDNSWPIIIGVTAVLVVAVIAISLFAFTSSPSDPLINKVQAYSFQGGQHDEADLPTNPLPPAGGVHSPYWQNCGVYSQPIANKNAIHAMEHGAVWITYRPDRLSPEDVAKLQNLTRQSGYRLLSPYPSLSYPVVLSAWNFQMPMDKVDEARIRAFMQKYEQSQGAPEPGSSCSGGIGTPE